MDVDTQKEIEKLAEELAEKKPFDAPPELLYNEAYRQYVMYGIRPSNTEEE